LLSLLCAAASPLAALFLGLLACADWAVNRQTARTLALLVPGLALSVSLVVALPEGGYEPFSTTSLLAAVGATVCVLLLTPSRLRLARAVFSLYLLLLLGCYLLRSPVGSNAVRFGVLFAAPTLIGCASIADLQARTSSLIDSLRRAPPACHRRVASSRRAAVALLGACVALMASWQMTGPLTQSVSASQTASSRTLFYRPAIRFLTRAAHGRPIRIEVPFTDSHWDATVLGSHFPLARGWDRQLDTRYDQLFYEPHLTASRYRAWLVASGVSYVALSDATLDFSSVAEAALIRAKPSYLRLVDRTRDWQIYEVRHSPGLLDGPGTLSALDGDGFTIDARRPGRFLTRIHYTPYWTVSSGTALVRARDGWTEVSVRSAGTVRVDAGFSLEELDIGA
jgi:hypothetical protein